MNISITLPDSLANQLNERWIDLPRRTLEAVVAQAFRERVVSGPEAQRILGLSSRIELDAFLKRSGIYLDYDEDDLEADVRTLDELLA